MKQLLQRSVQPAWDAAWQRCADWSGQRVAALHPAALLDVGCGDGSFLLRYLGNWRPTLCCGVEASPQLKAAAAQRGWEVETFDLNGRWPYANASFDAVHCSQIIEHLHNIRLFFTELHRVLQPGGTAVITSENLTSWLNTSAMLLGYTPFTLMRVCGWYLGNPLGLHAGEHVPEDVPLDHPAYSGVTGHIRALSVLQAEELMTKIGFSARVWSIGLMPLPESLSRRLERLCPRRGHFLLIEAKRIA
ncbi:MAG: class I SAM-dependent methyltransferase [Verrucomicrobia bacterium]|nr:MAG: class I SAM-dependent methyltransferase [Verrucomicrobiota bacterium]